ncbi:MAG: tripartite tricarboxylate transporter substrate-binding protein [Ottowia sp.]|uniref:Bug family tripartite tricarboxylate transporter substrate binding protein n=1 Tax=Ottowia sp. TaxID=1898956 RepID=UPI003C75A75A
MEIGRRGFIGQLGAVAAVAPMGVWAQAQLPIKIYVGNAPGGISDTVARLMAEHMAPALGRTMVVENKPGAGGNIAAEFVARAPADGNSLLVIYNAHPSIPALYPNLSFDLIKDLRSVGFVLGTPYLIVGRPDLPGKTLAEVLEQARRSGKALSFASPGSGSPQHLMAVQLGIKTGVPITVVHYKGVAPGQADVMGGHVDLTISSISIGLPQVQAGKLKALAVTSADRLPRLPQVLTIKEQGITGFVEQGWIAVVMSAKTPDATVKRYNEELNRMLGRPEIKARFDVMGAVPLPGTPEALDRTIHDEMVLWSKLIKDLGIKGD